MARRFFGGGGSGSEKGNGGYELSSDDELKRADIFALKDKAAELLRSEDAFNIVNAALVYYESFGYVRSSFFPSEMLLTQYLEYHHVMGSSHGETLSVTMFPARI